MPLVEFVTLQRGHDLVDSQRRQGTVPILGSFGITGWHNVAKARGPGVTIGRSGASYGVVSYSPVDYWPLNTALYVTDFHGNDERFAYYFLQCLDLKSYNSGSAQPSLNRNFIHPILVDVPPLSEQRAIASILGTLDDKIELNRRMNATLEAMARALFQSWFVDFDPVRAKAEGRDPGLPAEIADLFPDGFEESELGEVPRGWKVIQLGEIVEFAYGKALKEQDRRAGPIPVFGSNGLIGWHDQALARGPGIVIGRKGNPGVVTWSPSDFYCIDTTFYVTPKSSGTSIAFLYYALDSLNLPHLSADSAVPGLSRNLAYLSKMLIPPNELMRYFMKAVWPMFCQKQQKELDISLLAALRDALLPKLISGEVRVAEAERWVESV